MPAPLIFIATNKLKPGALGAEQCRVRDLCRYLEASEPRLIAFHEYANEDGTEVCVVQVHPDAASMEFHLGVVRDRAERAYDETLDATASIQVFGPPSPAILAMLRVQAGSGVPTTIRPLHLGGFTRPRP
jgi:hypothetical protein